MVPFWGLSIGPTQIWQSCSNTYCWFIAHHKPGRYSLFYTKKWVCNFHFLPFSTARLGWVIHDNGAYTTWFKWNYHQSFNNYQQHATLTLTKQIKSIFFNKKIIIYPPFNINPQNRYQYWSNDLSHYMNHLWTDKSLYSPWNRTTIFLKKSIPHNRLYFTHPSKWPTTRCNNNWKCNSE